MLTAASPQQTNVIKTYYWQQVRKAFDAPKLSSGKHRAIEEQARKYLRDFLALWSRYHEDLTIALGGFGENNSLSSKETCSALVTAITWRTKKGTFLESNFSPANLAYDLRKQREARRKKQQEQSERPVLCVPENDGTDIVDVTGRGSIMLRESYRTALQTGCTECPLTRLPFIEPQCVDLAEQLLSHTHTERSLHEIPDNDPISGDLFNLKLARVLGLLQPEQSQLRAAILAHCAQVDRISVQDLKSIIQQQGLVGPATRS